MRPAKLHEVFSIEAVPGYLGRASDLRGAHSPELLGLRGIAIMIVVCGHLLQRVERSYGEASLTALEQGLFNFLATPFTGCRLLFCISGYALFLSLHNRTPVFDTVLVVRSVKKRLLRLWPPYFVVLAATFLFITITGYKPIGTYQFDVQPESLTLSFLVSAIFSHDLVFDTFPRLFPPGWFLEVHVQFYLVGTLIWLAYLRTPAGRLRLIIGSMILILLSIGSLLAMQYGSRGTRYSLIAFMPYFWIGALLADFKIYGSSPRIDEALRRYWLTGWLGFALLISLGWPFDAALLPLLAQIFCLGLIVSAAFVKSGFRRVIIGRWLARIGVASYSIYLVHLQVLHLLEPILVQNFVRLPVPVVVTVCVVCGLSAVMASSLLFYWLIERPWVAIALRPAAQRKVLDEISARDDRQCLVR